MEYKEITGNKNMFIALDPDDVRAEFDNGVTITTLMYFDGRPDGQNSIYEIKAEISDEYICDTYQIEGDLSKSVKIRASLDLGERAYQEKGGVPQGYETVIGLQANHRLKYIPRIDMKSVRP